LLVTFAFSLSTDLLDGNLARRWRPARSPCVGLPASFRPFVAILAASRIRVNSYRLETHPSFLRHQTE